jgi:hypothetical protein
VPSCPRGEFQRSPNPLAFGIVNTGNTATQTLTFTNLARRTPEHHRRFTRPLPVPIFSFVDPPDHADQPPGGARPFRWSDRRWRAAAPIEFTHNAAVRRPDQVDGYGQCAGWHVVLPFGRPNVGDALTGLRDTVCSLELRGKALRALQFRIITARTAASQRRARRPHCGSGKVDLSMNRSRPVNPSTSRRSTPSPRHLGGAGFHRRGVGPHDLAISLPHDQPSADTTTTMSLAETRRFASTRGGQRPGRAARWQNIGIRTRYRSEGDSMPMVSIDAGSP